MTQASLARAAGIAQAQISQIETGTREDPQFSTIARLADVLGISLDQIASDCGLRKVDFDLAQSLNPSDIATAAEALRNAIQATRDSGKQITDALNAVHALERRVRRTKA